MRVAFDFFAIFFKGNISFKKHGKLRTICNHSK